MTTLHLMSFFQTHCASHRIKQNIKSIIYSRSLNQFEYRALSSSKLSDIELNWMQTRDSANIFCSSLKIDIKIQHFVASRPTDKLKSSPVSPSKTLEVSVMLCGIVWKVPLHWNFLVISSVISFIFIQYIISVVKPSNYWNWTTGMYTGYIYYLLESHKNIQKSADNMILVLDKIVNINSKSAGGSALLEKYRDSLVVMILDTLKPVVFSRINLKWNTWAGEVPS